MVALSQHNSLSSAALKVIITAIFKAKQSVPSSAPLATAAFKTITAICISQPESEEWSESDSIIVETWLESSQSGEWEIVLEYEGSEIVLGPVLQFLVHR